MLSTEGPIEVITEEKKLNLGAGEVVIEEHITSID